MDLYEAIGAKLSKKLRPFGPRDQETV